MNIRYTIKQLGKKKALLTEKSLEIDHDTAFITLRDLISAIVSEQVRSFNQKTFSNDHEDTTHAPMREYVDLLTETGKAGFDQIYHEKKADCAKAIENAWICFEDGIIAIFQGEEQLTSLDEEIDLTHDTPFTFLRLTFLAGSYW